VRYDTTELELNGLLDSRWPGDASHIPWDFAAVGHGAHDAQWWQTFAAALTHATTASTLSIEHEDRLVPPEDGITASAQLLRGFAGDHMPGRT